MSLLSQELLISSLQTIVPDRSSITKIARYIVINRKDASNIKQIFSDIYNNSNICHRLSLLYVANEIFNYPLDIQNAHCLVDIQNFLKVFIKEKIGEDVINNDMPGVKRKIEELKCLWERNGVLDVHESVFDGLECLKNECSDKVEDIALNDDELRVEKHKDENLEYETGLAPKEEQEKLDTSAYHNIETPHEDRDELFRDNKISKIKEDNKREILKSLKTKARQKMSIGNGLKRKSETSETIFARKEIIEKINKYFDSKEELICVLERFVKHLKRKGE